MAGKGGARPGAGKPKGSKNKRTRELMKILDEHGYCPIAEQIRIASLAEKEYARSALIYDKIEDARIKENITAPLKDSAPEYLNIMQRCAAGVAPYAYPKLKATEHRLDETSLTTFAEMVKNATDAKRKANSSS